MTMRWRIMGMALLATVSAAAAEEIRDIPYYEADTPAHGDAAYRQERCKLDLYYPKGEEGFPTVIWFHGGGLVGGEKFIPELLKDSGIAVIAPNYRLSSERAKCPDYLEDAAAATAWAFRHIAEYGGDPEALYLSGGSGGGYLAAMVGMNPAYLQAHGIDVRRLAGIMPISGQMTTHMQVLNERNGTTGLGQPRQQAIDEYAPLYYAAKDLAPIVLFVGDPKIEWPARVEENAMLAAMLQRVAGHTATEFISLAGFDHGDVYDPAFLLMKKKIREACIRKLPNTFPKPVLTVNPTETPIVIDGDLLADPAWEEEGADWQELVSRLGKPFEPESVVAMRCDSEYLYIAMVCVEPEIAQPTLGRAVWDGDCVEVMLARAGKVGQWVAAPDGRTAFVDLGLGDAVNAGVKMKVGRLDEFAWTLEMAIPLADLGMTPENRPEWSANFYRRRLSGGDNRYANWSPTGVELNLRPEAFGTLQ